MKKPTSTFFGNQETGNKKGRDSASKQENPKILKVAPIVQAITYKNRLGAPLM